MSNTALASTDAAPMASDKSVTFGVRVPAELVPLIDAKQLEMQRSARGAAISRSDAVRALILAGLEAESKAAAKGR